jgi:hypothetical protein
MTTVLCAISAISAIRWLARELVALFAHNAQGVGAPA